ncbi:VOC family protein [Agrococcus sp. SGAir0287]|uniref:VOC family protein n=1 Tax=Agrococcus sp. SGAir0287 TaxID=2070347 RepID=UPI0010CCFB00|nr:VOC family protein [Agrococcus sp. SGAir0287]QCR18985.1 glyoxalase [Agrococcus sp. SGAir0287]
MRITATALSLTVPDPQASADFATRHLGFARVMTADGVISLAHQDGGANIVLLREGLASFRPRSHAGSVRDGLLLAFVVDDLDAEHARIVAEGATVATPPETEPWGERYCQYLDANGIVWQLVQWVTPEPGVTI